MSYGLYGGSFDPVHRGHLEQAAAARQWLGLDRIVFLPARRPPHKPDRVLASDHHRFALLAASVLEAPWAEVSPWELEQVGTTYAWQQVEAFGRQCPGEDLVLLLGADSLADLGSWARWQDLTASTAIAVLPRDPWQRQELESHLPAALLDRTSWPEDDRRGQRPAAGETWVLPLPIVTISATEVRRRLRDGEPVEHLLPSNAAELIRRHHLYREATRS